MSDVEEKSGKFVTDAGDEMVSESDSAYLGASNVISQSAPTQPPEPPDVHELMTHSKSSSTGQFMKTGRFAFRMTQSMAQRIVRQCIRQGSSLSDYVRRALVQQLEQDERTDPAGRPPYPHASGT
jgi:hypothetical protein